VGGGGRAQLEQDIKDFRAALAWALPVRPELRGPLSAWILNKKLAGALTAAQQIELLNPNPAVCAV
jgi:hypothetical protein